MLENNSLCPTLRQPQPQGGPPVPSTLISGFKYNAFGSPTEYLTGDNVKSAFTYDVRNRMQSKSANRSAGSGSSVFSLSSFGWAANNSLTGVNDNGITRSYTYEDFNRLASSTRVSTPTNYSYDRFGNRYTAGSQSVSFDANNHVTSGNGVGYDAAGNTTSEIVGGTTNTYTYDAENRLISVNSGNIATYVYDALGRRAKRTVSGTGTEYLYDLNGRAISELASSGGGLIRTELYAGSRHFATYVASSTFFVYSDWQGTERVRTDPSANVAEYCEWTPWGEFSSCTSGYSYTDPTVLSTYNYAGYERDSETGLDHMWYRYNDSRYGRFMTTDPKEGKSCSPQSLDLYPYVLDNPVNFGDDKGLDPFSFSRRCYGDCPLPSSFCGTNAQVIIDGFYVSPDFYCKPKPIADGANFFAGPSGGSKIGKAKCECGVLLRFPIWGECGASCSCDDDYFELHVVGFPMSGPLGLKVICGAQIVCPSRIEATKYSYPFGVSFRANKCYFEW